ncbi:SH3 domain-containing protein [Helicobacter sp. T3_23-1056]
MSNVSDYKNAKNSAKYALCKYAFKNFIKNIIANGFLLACCLALIGCSIKEINLPAKDPSIYSQDALTYLSKADKYANKTPDKQTKQKLESLAKNYIKEHFSAWELTKANPDKKAVFWAQDSLLKNTGFGENLFPNSLEMTKEIYERMNIKAYPSTLTKAIITETTDVRAVPSDKPRFKRADDYPFDQWQNSLIFANTPVMITHYDTSKEWAHIQSGFVYGWVKVRDLAIINANEREILSKISTYILPVRDKIPIYDRKGDFLTYARIGQILGVAKEVRSDYVIYIAKREILGKATLIEARVKQKDFMKFPQSFSPMLSAQIINTMMGHKYGWGGYLSNRDCSAFIRDVFANFGLYMPRNSYSQGRWARNMVELDKLDRTQKEKYILENGVPFASILWLKGHIMLYIGEYKGKAMVAHSSWSVRTKKKRVFTKSLLGGVVITSLYAGEENNAKDNYTLLIDRIGGISNLLEKLQDKQE